MDSLERKELKDYAKKHVKKEGKVAYAIAAIPLVLSFASGAFSEAPLLRMLVSAVATVAAVVLPVTFWRMQRGETYSFQTHILDEGWNNFLPYLMLGFVRSLYVMLWSLLLVVPGICKAFSYIFAPHIQHENPEWSPNQVLTESGRLAKGKVGAIFMLYLGYYAVPALLFVLGTVAGYLTLFQMLSFMMVSAPDIFFFISGALTLLFLGIGTAWTILVGPKWHTAVAKLYDTWK